MLRVYFIFLMFINLPCNGFIRLPSQQLSLSFRNLHICRDVVDGSTLENLEYEVEYYDEPNYNNDKYKGYKEIPLEEGSLSNFKNSGQVVNNKEIIVDLSNNQPFHQKGLSGMGIGIDLGTTNSAVAAIIQGKPVLLADPKTGARTIPSVVAYGPSDEILVGVKATEKFYDKEWKVFQSVKRVIGKTISETVMEGEDLSFYHVVDKEDRLKYMEEKGQLDELSRQLQPVLMRTMDASKFITPEDVSSQVLKRLKATAEEKLGLTVTRAVVTVPADFNQEQREATERAGLLAGFEKIKLLKVARYFLFVMFALFNIFTLLFTNLIN